MTRKNAFATLTVLFAVSPAAPALAAGYTDEAQFLADLAAGGYFALVEDFEGNAWDPYRTINPFDPQAAASVTSLGIRWTGNDLLSTNTNWGRGGSWGVFTIFSGGVPTPDTLAGVSQNTLYAVGGWINVNPDTGGDIAIVIDGQVVADRNIGAGHQFIGVIVPEGFTSFEIVDLEQQTAWGADDFTFAIITTGDGDVDADGHVDLTDLGLLLGAYAACAGDAGFNAAADFDGSGCIDLTDLGILLANYGT